MFKGKAISPLLVLFSLLISYSEPRAVPAPPHPICAINATGLDIQKTKTQIGGRGPNYSYVDHYAVKLQIYNFAVTNGFMVTFYQISRFWIDKNIEILK